jgi:hypothetical protein
MSQAKPHDLQSAATKPDHARACAKTSNAANQHSQLGRCPAPANRLRCSSSNGRLQHLLSRRQSGGLSRQDGSLAGPQCLCQLPRGFSGCLAGQRQWQRPAPSTACGRLPCQAAARGQHSRQLMLKGTAATHPRRRELQAFAGPGTIKCVQRRWACRAQQGLPCGRPAATAASRRCRAVATRAGYGWRDHLARPAAQPCLRSRHARMSGAPPASPHAWAALPTSHHLSRD